MSDIHNRILLAKKLWKGYAVVYGASLFWAPFFPTALPFLEAIPFSLVVLAFLAMYRVGEGSLTRLAVCAATLQWLLALLVAAGTSSTLQVGSLAFAMSLALPTWCGKALLVVGILLPGVVTARLLYVLGGRAGPHNVSS